MLIPFGVFSAAGAGGGGGGAGSYDLISSTILASTQATITFDTSALSAYKHLQLRMATRSTRGTDNDSLYIRFNSDTGSNYARHGLTGNGSSVSSFGVGSTNLISVGETSASTSGTSVFGATVIDILDFGNTSKNKTVRSFNGKHDTAYGLGLYSGAWLNTAAVTSIDIKVFTGPNFAVGSRFSIYGIKGV